MSSPQSVLLLPSCLPPPSPLARVTPRPPSSPPLIALRFPRLAAKLSPPPLAASPPPPGGFRGCGDTGGNDGGGGGEGSGGTDPPDPGDGWWRRWLQALHPEFLLLFLLLQSGAASALAEALGATGDDAGGVWEVRGGARTRLVPDPTWTSYLIAGDDGSKLEEGDAKGAGSSVDVAALQRQLERSWRRCTDVAVQLLLPDGYPHSVSSDYLKYSLWRAGQSVASQISGVLSTQVSVDIRVSVTILSS